MVKCASQIAPQANFFGCESIQWSNMRLNCAAGEKIGSSDLQRAKCALQSGSQVKNFDFCGPPTGKSQILSFILPTQIKDFDAKKEDNPLKKGHLVTLHNTNILTLYIG